MHQPNWFDTNPAIISQQLRAGPISMTRLRPLCNDVVLMLQRLLMHERLDERDSTGYQRNTEAQIAHIVVVQKYAGYQIRHEAILQTCDPGEEIGTVNLL